MATRPMIQDFVICLLICGLTATAGAQTTWHVDDDAPGDPGPGNSAVSDPLEDGSAAHPFDAIQEALDAAIWGDEVVVADGTYTGAGNRNLDYGGKSLDVHSANGPFDCVIDCEESGRGFSFNDGEPSTAAADGFTIMRGSADKGGGIACNDNSNPAIMNCIIAGNNAFHNGGGLFCDQSDPAVINCLFYGNTSGYNGGGMTLQHSESVLTNCTIAGNASGSGSGNGGGGAQVSIGSNVTMTNCIFKDNEAAEGPEIRLLGSSNPSTLNISYTNVFGGINRMFVNSSCTLNWGDGNLDVDPQFVDEVNYDYQLVSGISACVDAGTNSPAGGLPASDIAGVFRPIDGDGDVEPWTGSAATADMGAFEAADLTAPLICLEEYALTFFVEYEAPEAVTQALLIRNCGGGTLAWTLFEDCPWLEVEPVAGESAGEWDEASLIVDVAGLAEGEYSYVLEVIDEAANNSPQAVEVQLLVYSRIIIYVDDDSPNDPGPGDTSVSDPLEDGSEAHPYDAIQEALDAAQGWDEVVVADGRYTGIGNRDLDYGGKGLRVRSANGPFDCVIDCQRAGRGFYFDDGEPSRATADGFTITGGDEGGGGGIQCRNGSNPLIINCIITDNMADVGGGIWCMESSPVIANCLIEDNLAWNRGGGVGLKTSGTTLVNCTIVDNTAYFYGGGVYSLNYDCSTMTNCILWENLSSYGNAIGMLDSYATLTVSYSDVEGGYAETYVESTCMLIWGDGNIDADPQFRHLQLLADTSPCIDAGDDTAVPLDTVDIDGDGDATERLPLDIDGLYRFADRPGTADTGVADSPNYPYVVDMGAYEFAIYGDLNGDGSVNVADLSELLTNYGLTSGVGYTDGDLDGDGDVDLSDLAGLLADYGETCP